MSTTAAPEITEFLIERSPLPPQPDRRAADDWLEYVYRDMWGWRS